MLVDQYLYKARIITDEEMNNVNEWIIDDVESAGYHLIDIDDYFDENNSMYKELLPYCRKCEVNDIFIDYDMVKAVYHIPNMMKLWKFENDNKYITLTFAMDSDYPEEYIKVVRLTEGEYFGFINKEPFPYYVVYLEDIYSWQNNMNLYNDIHQFKNMDDCSFYQLDDEMLECILNYVKHDYILEEDLKCSNNEALFYYEEC